MRFPIACLLCLAAAAPAAAHDFWIAPDQYAAETGAPVEIDFFVGHGASADLWDLRWRRVVSLETRLGDRAQSRLGDLIPVTDGEPGATLRFDADGHYVVAFASHHAVSELPAERFEGYLEEEGLTLAARTRADAGTTGEPGREIYSRRAKTLIDVGDAQAGDPTMPVGHTLEIVPLSDPYAADFDGALAVRVLFRGAPLEGAQVSLDSQAIGRTLATERTGSDGVARFDVARQGGWMLNTVWSTPLISDGRADFETIFASLTFGYAP
ncbi:MAG: DUF4198 domain-containing protein [Oceanicaulis sp.]